MINPGQFLLELVLVIAALALSRSLAGRQHRRFIIGFAALAAVVNCAFYYFAVGPLYLARGFDRSVLVGAVAFETIRWGVLAFVLSRLAARLQDIGVTSGFALRQNPERAGSVLGLGLAVANGEPLDVRLATGAGFRNLVGEEVFARLGAQSIALYFLRQLRGGAGLAIVASSLYFEIWHNPFELPQFLNFAASCVLGWAYHKHGYEVAAVGHCVADWLALGVLPSLLFG